MMAERYTYVLNASKEDTVTLPTTFAAKDDAFPATAFSECSVNPIIKSTGISEEATGVSANFFEIRNGPYDGMISCDSKDYIVNRYYPNNKTISDYGAGNQEQTRPHKLRTEKNSVGQNVYNLSPVINLEDNDWFVLINPDYEGNDGTTIIKPHFAKIKQIIAYDNYGDGIEFEPKYPSAVPKGAKFELFKGPAVTDTDVVAVSYGLRGSTAISGLKYDEASKVSKPTWYFYEDRLVNKNQLDFNTKYNLTTCRWFSDYTRVSTDGNVILGSQIAAFGPPSDITFSNLATTDLIKGQSIFLADQSNRIHFGNVTDITSGLEDELEIDYARYGISSGNWPTGTYPVYIGRTIHHSIFRTEREYGTIVNDLGLMNHDALFVDKVYDSDTLETDYDDGISYASSQDPSKWRHIIRNNQRTTDDKINAQTATSGGEVAIHGNASGANRYLYYKSAKLKNNIISTVMESVVNNPRNKMTQMARVTTLDHAGIQHLKLKEDHSLTIRSTIFAGNMKEFELPYTVTGSVSGGSYFLTVNQTPQEKISGASFDEFDLRNDNYINVGDMIRVNDYYYIISAIAAPTGNSQKLTINRKKKLYDTIFSAISSLESIVGQKAYVKAWNGGVRGSIPIDTEGVYDDNAFTRLTINDNTISKKNNSLYNTKLSFLEPQYMGHDITVDYGDSLNSYIKLQNSTKKYYNPSNANSFLYYFTGKFAMDEEVFVGTIEDIESKLEHGMLTYEISGRDTISKLLSNTTSKNLNVTNDVVYSSLNPIFDDVTAIHINSTTTTGGVLSLTVPTVLAPLPQKYDLILDENSNLLAEVKELATVAGSNTTFKIQNQLETITAGDDLKLVRLTHNNYISSIKSMSTNIKAVSYPTDLSSAGNKGLVFADGKGITYASNGDQTFSDLAYTSATGQYDLDSSLGYDLSSVKGISEGNDSNFMFKLAQEKEASISYNNVITPSSPNYYSVVSSVKKEGENTTLTLAPTFPVVLGSITTNTSDTRLDDNSYLYLVNRNIPSGGFLHTLQDTITTNYSPKQTFRYTDLQEFNPGTLKYTVGSVYNDGSRAQNILGATPAWCIKQDGSTVTAATTTSLVPIEGSNLIDDAWNAKYNELTNSYKFKISSNTQLKLPQHYPNIDIDNQGDITNPDNWLNNSNTGVGNPEPTTEDVLTSRFINTDPRVSRYELLALGDIYPESQLRHNHLGFSEQNLVNYGLLVEAEADKGNSISHEKYTGNTNEVKRKDNSYQRMNISDASITSNQINRFGIMRLVEATFDWHFNPVDMESVDKTDNMTKLQQFRYPRFSPPIDLQRDVITNLDSVDLTFYATGTTTLTDTVVYPGDLIYDATTGNLLAMYIGVTHPANTTNTGATTVTVTGNGDDDWVDDDWVIFNDVLSAVSAYVIRNNYYYKTSDDTVRHNFPGIIPFNIYASPGGRELDEVNINDLYMNNAYIVGGNLNKNYLDYTDGLSYVDTSPTPDVTHTSFNAHNIFIPMISGLHRSQESGVERKRYFSAFHDIPQWEEDNTYWTGTDPVYHHTSRVVAALALETFKEGVGVNWGGLAHYNNGKPLNHIYDNCIANFQDFKKIVGDSVSGISSAPLELDTTAAYATYFDYEGNDVDQHSRNLMITRKGRNKALIGTKTANSNLFGSGRNTKTNHFEITSQSSSAYLYNSQMFIKPTVNLSKITSGTLSSHGCSLSSTTLTFQMNDNSTHHWMAFMPNLTGYYLVSEQFISGARLSNQAKAVFSSKSGSTITVLGYAAATITCSDNPSPNETISITSTDGTTKTYTARYSIDEANNEFDKDGEITEVMSSLKTCIEHSSGHNGKITVTQSAGKLILTQATAGEAGETTITSNLSNTTVTNFIASNGTEEFPTSGKITIAGSYVDESSDTINGSQVVTYTEKTATTFKGCKLDTTRNWNDNNYGDVITQYGNEKKGVPSLITRITGHELEVNGGYTEHELTLDTAITTATHGTKFRLMRISETTFEDTPEKIEILQMHDTGLKYDTTPFDLVTGVIDNNNPKYQEALYSMYMLLHIDEKDGNFLDRRTIGTMPDQLDLSGDFYITDGNTSALKTIRGQKVTDTSLTFHYDGNLTGNGVVSFGETFTVDSPSNMSITGKRAYLGSTISIGTDIEIAIEEILEENDIDIDTSERNLVYTSNIVEIKPPSTTITLYDNAINLTSGDIIYNQDGKLIGELSATPTSNAVSVSTIYYKPIANDELVKYTRLPFIDNTNFNEHDVFNSINYLAAKRSLEYIFVNNKVKINSMDNYDTKRKFSARWRDSNNILGVNSNKSLFDKANKIIVIGDNVKATAEEPTNDTARVIKHIDPNIKTIQDARVLASNLLEIHNQDSRKITVKLEKTGYELMKPGDLITLNFPLHGIPADDYIIFEIENVMSSVLTITVGTFNKTIAERLSQINITQDKGFTNLFTKEVSQTVTDKIIPDSFDLEEESLKYQLTQTTGGSTIGFA